MSRDEKIAAIKQMSGLTAAEMCERIPGSSRNSIIGFCYRNDLDLSNRATGILLENLKPHQCKWPINDGGPYLFCGKGREPGSPYCHEHKCRSVGNGTEAERSAHRILKRLISS